ncbi:tripartite tricarboxylate transporter substrate binding protein [Pigmentiphaga soli]|uniref:Tripartite tricarboxylate transporter substrate binding protein n=1 Tax=Pigmentiphaga soli TaxID=1007095 RepID=A0ABP8H066_9BURK
MHTAGLPELRILAGAALLVVSGQAVSAGDAASQAAANYPDKPIRIIAPSSPGGGIDVLARLLGARITESWGKSVVVDNRPGASGIIGTQAVAQAAPDGYTILLVAGGYTLNPSLYKKLPYDTMNDFERVSLLACAPNMLVVANSVPAKSVQELVAYAKAHPDSLTYASSGIGTTSYLSAALFQQRAGIKMVHIPYKGAGESNKAMVAGEVNLIFSAPHEMIPYARDGRVRPLAVTSAQRLPLVADIPTVAESGFPGFDVNTCYGVLVPAKTPRPIVDKLSAKFVELLRTPEVRSQLEGLSFALIGSTPEEFTKWARKDMARWPKELSAAGIQPQ